jgi:hypothetical protein
VDKYEELFKAVTEKPEDFNTWTSLINAAEKLVRCMMCYLCLSRRLQQYTTVSVAAGLTLCCCCCLPAGQQLPFAAASSQQQLEPPAAVACRTPG